MRLEKLTQELSEYCEKFNSLAEQFPIKDMQVNQIPHTHFLEAKPKERGGQQCTEHSVEGRKFVHGVNFSSINESAVPGMEI